MLQEASHQNSLTDIGHLDCTNLLPQSSNAIIRDTKMQQQIINFTAYICSQFILTLQTFYLDKNYSAFDPHVGDTACQIRAYQTILLAEKPVDEKHILERIQFLQQICAHLENWKKLSENANFFGCNNQFTIKKFLQTLHVFFTITPQEAFLVKSFFLTNFKTKTSITETFINHDAICQKAKISKKFAKKITRHYQIDLAKDSVNTIKKLAQELDPNNYPVDLLEQLIKHDDDDRPTLPCYLYSKIIFEHMLKNNTPVVLIANNRKPLYYLPTPNKDKYIMLQAPEDISAAPCLVFHGKNNQLSQNDEEYQESIKQTTLKDLWLSNMAAHPQYSGNKLSPYKTNPFPNLNTPRIKQLHHETILRQKQAIQSGFCHKNSAKFLISHIISDNISFYQTTKVIPFPKHSLLKNS